MRLSIDNRDVRAVFSFTPRQYLLVRVEDLREPMPGEIYNFIWTLCPRIDRSEKGKDDDIGLPVLYLSDAEASVLKESGFAYRDERD